MNIKENLLYTVPKKTYLEYLKFQLRLRGEGAKNYLMIIFTLATLSFFGIFVINPTLSTITELNKQLTDAKLFNEQLEKKIQVLDTLANQHSRLKTDIPIVLNALPTEPTVLPLLGKVETLARESNLTIARLEVSKVELTKGKGEKKDGSFQFSMTARGVYVDIKQFLNRLILLDRIVVPEEISVRREDQETSLLDENIRILQITGRTYFKS